ncbi:MAG: hypothetical protein KAH84_11745 [Thiomargarita sp.]|nr:hypothetical protein [Thiomargarita sp.]
MVWQRNLKRYDEDIIGASSQTIVLGTLEVIDPKTGTTLEPVIGGSTKRKWPKYSFRSLNNPTVFRKKTRYFVLFKAKYSLFSTQGGLYLFNPKQEVKKLIRKGKRRFIRHLNVRNMALSEDERFVFLAQLWETRGPYHIEFAIFDLEKKQTVFKERLENNCRGYFPIIMVGRNGHVTISYGCKRKHVIVHYVISF